MQSNKIFFDHENLVVYQKSLEVVAFIDTIFDKIKTVQSNFFKVNHTLFTRFL